VDNAATTPGDWSFWTVRAGGQIITWLFGLAFFHAVVQERKRSEERV
jgi:cytochrome c biogenesis factor